MLLSSISFHFFLFIYYEPNGAVDFHADKLTMQVDEVLFHFKAKLESLKDWPDKLIIMELTAFTEASIAIAPHFVNIIGKVNGAYKITDNDIY